MDHTVEVGFPLLGCAPQESGAKSDAAGAITVEACRAVFRSGYASWRSERRHKAAQGWPRNKQRRGGKAGATGQALKNPAIPMQGSRLFPTAF